MAVLVCYLEARKETSTGGGLWIWAVRDILQGKERITFPFSGDGDVGMDESVFLPQLCQQALLIP